MDWLNPTYFWAFVALPLAVVLFLWAAWQRRQALQTFGDSALVARLVGSVSTRRRRWKAALIVLAMALLAVCAGWPTIW